MTAKVICMASAKGGSGKTTLTTTFATLLAALNKKVLMIDTDSATNGLTLLHLKEVVTHGNVTKQTDRPARGIFEIPSIDVSQYTEDMLEDASASTVTLPSKVDLIPAAYDFGNTETVDPEVYRDGLIRTVSGARSEYDFVFLDAQAGSDLFAQIAMSKEISDEVVIVSEYDPMSAAGVERMKALFRKDLTYDRTWILLNKILPEFAKSFSEFLEVAKYLSPVPWDADVVRAYARRRIAIDLEQGNDYTLATMQTLESLFGDRIREELDSWRSKKIASIRQPAVDQYADTEKMIDGLLRDIARLVRLRERRNLVFSFVPALIALFLGAAAFLVDLKALGFNDISETLRIFVAAAVVVAGAYLGRSALAPTSERFLDDIDSERRKLERRVAILDEKLKKLAAIKEADLGTLIKMRPTFGASSEAL